MGLRPDSQLDVRAIVFILEKEEKMGMKVKTGKVTIEAEQLNGDRIKHAVGHQDLVLLLLAPFHDLVFSEEVIGEEQTHQDKDDTDNKQNR